MTADIEAHLLAGDDLIAVKVAGPAHRIDAPAPLEPLPDFRASVKRALRIPMGLAPLPRMVSRGARVTVAFDDPCLPLPPPLLDPRRVVLEEVVDTLIEAGVKDEDITLVCANGLHRQWSAWELLPILGPRLLARFRGRIVCHDAEDPQGVVSLGPTITGLEVEVSHLVAEADLVVYVGIPWTEMNGGHKSVACGLSTYRCIDQHHSPGVQAASPLFDPEGSEMHRRLREIGRAVGSRVPVFQVETVVNNRIWAGPLSMLDLQSPRLKCGAALSGRLPAILKRLTRRSLRSFYQPVGVWAGAVEAVHQAALERIRGASARFPAQADVLILGLPNLSPYSVYSDTNPLLVANMGLGYAFQFGRPCPLVRRGGWLVLATPCSESFHSRHHTAYCRFWEEILPVTKDPYRMEAEFEAAFVADGGLVDAYRHRRAYHPVHPFYAWYWMSRALVHLGGVIMAGCRDDKVAGRMGFAAALSVEEALDRTREVLGRDAVAVLQAVPPVFTVQVGS